MQSSHAGKQRYKNALSFFFSSFVNLSVRILCHPRFFTGESVIVFQKKHFSRACGEKNFVQTRWQNISFPSLSRTLSSFHDAKFSILFLKHLHLDFLFFPTLDLLCTETFFQSHADSWFVYQNIDLFSLYTFTLALLLVHFFSFSPSPRAPLTGRPFLVIDLPVKQSLAARGTRGRQGSICLGISCA